MPLHSLLLALTVALLVGCRPSFQAQYEQLYPGDTRARAIKLLGEPERSGWLTVDPFAMGPPEALAGLVAPGIPVEELEWRRDTPDGAVTYLVYLSEAGRVLALTHYAEGDVF